MLDQFGLEEKDFNNKAILVDAEKVIERANNCLRDDVITEIKHTEIIKKVKEKVFQFFRENNIPIECKVRIIRAEEFFWTSTILFEVIDGYFKWLQFSEDFYSNNIPKDFFDCCGIDDDNASLLNGCKVKIKIEDFEIKFIEMVEK